MGRFRVQSCRFRGGYTIVVVVAVLAASATAETPPEETHTWTSANGKYSIEATLVYREYDRTQQTTIITLRRNDGTLVEVPQAKLSQESRDLARRLAIERGRAARQEQRGLRAADSIQQQVASSTTARRREQLAREAGKVVAKQTPHGSYLQYVPSRTPHGIVVVVHGTPADDQPAIDNAAKYIEHWIAPAEEHAVLVVAPAFDAENFGSTNGPGGGYRGLYGREIGADEFVHEIVDQYRMGQSAMPNKFILYGHSAGGQFVARYVVMHPERIVAAVISAAGKYAFPDPSAEWPYGMGTLTRTMKWPGSPVVKSLTGLSPIERAGSQRHNFPLRSLSAPKTTYRRGLALAIQATIGLTVPAIGCSQ